MHETQFCEGYGLLPHSEPSGSLPPLSFFFFLSLDLIKRLLSYDGTIEVE